jgi:hypothetical protein
MDPKDTELAELKAANDALRAKLTAADQTKLIEAKDTEISALKSTIKSLNDRLGEQARINAKAVVDAAIKSGRLPPQAVEQHAKLVDAIAANPALAETLNGLPPNPALAGQIAPGASQPAAGPATSKAEQFVAEVKAKAVELKSKEAAVHAVIQAKPDLYAAWREADGKPGF